ncbi:MAG TPA: hypothetical protein VML55_20445, partial [Planctomycetaceae bacterium]|nr:hypothetical protein [Planctomycetaceae bacterium]
LVELLALGIARQPIRVSLRHRDGRIVTHGRIVGDGMLTGQRREQFHVPLRKLFEIALPPLAEISSMLAHRR